MTDQSDECWERLLVSYCRLGGRGPGLEGSLSVKSFNHLVSSEEASDCSGREERLLLAPESVEAPHWNVMLVASLPMIDCQHSCHIT